MAPFAFTTGFLLCAVAFINPGSAHAQELSPTVYGCPWNADSLGNLQIGKTIGRQISYRFRCASAGELRGVRVYLIFRTDVREYGRGDGGEVLLELRADDETDDHHPSDKVLASVRVTDPTKDARPGDIAYRLFEFERPPTLEKGRLYHLVFSNPSPDPVNNYVSIDDLYSNEREPGVQPGVSDTDLAVIYTYSEKEPWAINLAHTPIFSLHFADGSYGGQAYINARSQSLLCKITGPAKVRQVFTMSGGDRTVTALHVRLRKTGRPGELTIRLDAQDGSLSESTLLPADSIAKEHRWITWKLPRPLDLKNGRSYQVLLTAPEGDAYEIYPLQEGTRNGFHSPTLFTDGHFEFTPGGAWQDERRGCDMQFYFAVQAETAADDPAEE